jgi:hypothetical protein
MRAETSTSSGRRALRITTPIVIATLLGLSMVVGAQKARLYVHDQAQPR